MGVRYASGSVILDKAKPKNTAPPHTCAQSMVCSWGMKPSLAGNRGVRGHSGKLSYLKAKIYNRICRSPKAHHTHYEIRRTKNTSSGAGVS